MQKTYSQKQAEITRQWHLTDASGKVLGRLASEVAQKLIGKHKPTYSAHLDAGDYVVVTNAAQVELTGNKDVKKVYRKHSGYVGNLQEQSYAGVLAKDPRVVIEKAVYNMLPKNKLRAARMKRLKVYPTAVHPHESAFSTEK